MADNDSALVILVVILAIIAGTLLVLFYLASKRNQKIAQNQAQQVNGLTCPPGQCATNVLTGTKTCPASATATISYTESNEVCNSPFVCDNPVTPYALNSDGSTNFQGVCAPNTTCPCVREQTCADYIVALFTGANGDPYSDLDGQRLFFPQSNLSITTGGATDQPPLIYSDPGTTFCTVPIAWLGIANPGCNFIETFSPTYTDVVNCMGLPNGCTGGYVANPCLQGTLAFVTDDSADFGQADIDTTPVGCVRGEPCPCGTVAIYDTQVGAITCKVLT